MPRITWPDLPDTVRARVEAILDGPVVEHASHPGGFSPGTADRVATAAGRVAFVKAVHADLNPDSPGIHRAELRVMRALPAALPAPSLIDGFELDGWVVLVLEYVDAEHPPLPWTPASFASVLDATLALSDGLTPTPLGDLQPLSEHAASMWAGFGRLVADTPDDLDPWVRDHLHELDARARRSLPTLDGDTLAHWDLRADNILVRPDGEVVFIDWPWAVRGARWVDAAVLAAEFAVDQDPVDHRATDAALRRIAAHCGVDTEPLVDALVGVTGFFVDKAREPAPPGLPTLRAFQRRLADGLVAWLRASELAGYRAE